MRRYKRKRVKRVLIGVLVIIIIVGGVFFVKETFKGDNNKSDEVINNNDTNILEKDEVSEDFITDVTLEKAPSNNEEFLSLSDGSYLTDKGYTLKIENRIASIDGILIVNKTYSLPSDYGDSLTNDVMEAFDKMKADALSLGLNLWIQSGYRSYIKQESIYNNYVARDGQNNADTYSARPGYSEHQSGLAFDLNTIDDSFTYTDEGKWVNDNCYRYGFILRYPEGKDEITGYIHESWHLRYVGVDLATKLYNDGQWITLEEYFGITSSY